MCDETIPRQLRDYLAGQALSGVLTRVVTRDPQPPTLDNARRVWAWVDMLLAARAERPPVSE